MFNMVEVLVVVFIIYISKVVCFYSSTTVNIRTSYKLPITSIHMNSFSIPDLSDSINNIQSLLAFIQSKSASIANIEINPPLAPLYSSTAAAVSIAVIFGLANNKNGTSKRLYDGGDDKYDSIKAEAYFKSKPLLIFQRLFTLISLTNGFLLKLLIDYKTGKLEKNQPIRAKEALILITQLGPTFIKLGQALSIRTDLIPLPYALELRQLQDAVPQFPTPNAYQIIRKELNITNLNEIFKNITTLPIASASIGQVYKGILLDNTEVAIKVQRPNILYNIALDLYILRLLTPIQVYISAKLNKRQVEVADIEVALSLVNEWGRGFIAEVDYKLEAQNTNAFILAMKRRGLNAVTAPEVIKSANKIIITKWIQGTRLDKDASSDVPRLCTVAVNAYLTMLLDTGILHCDPHPGNLLRTTDGKLCILDWGMTLTVPPDLQYSLLEFIAHINAEDYDALLYDFINLGFSPANKLEQLKTSGLTQGIAFTFRQLNKGGGANKMRERVGIELRERYGDMNMSDEELRAKSRQEMLENMQVSLKAEGVDVTDVTGVMEEMSRRNRELFKLPPYVLYLSRAFSTLEGIGLSINEDYSILQECYPYLARRLFSDNSPRAKEALRSMLFSRTSNMSPNKLIEMSKGFNSYTSAVVNTDRDNQGMREAEQAFVDLLLAPEGNALQDLLIEEAARITDAVLREGIDRTVKSSIGQLFSLAVTLPVNTMNALLPRPLQRFAKPFQLPYLISQGAVQLAKKNEEDEGILLALSTFATLPSSSVSSQESPSVTDINLNLVVTQIRKQLLDSDSLLRRSLADPEIRKRLPQLNRLTRKYSATLLTRFAERLDQSTGISSRENSINKSLAIIRQQPHRYDASVTERLALSSAKSARIISNFIRPEVISTENNSFEVAD